MKTTNNLIQLDSVLSLAELEAQKAQVVINDLQTNYFEFNNENEDDTKLIVYYHDKYNLISSIAADYISEILKHVKEALKLASSEIDANKQEREGEVNE